ncbi:hypothetical protein LC082_08575 [Microbacterium esteraromaticum]|uniref:hypothetical protein n=1 Tax=Microbacterium esteraromaticum TaxID=57043 RepID=UPI001CD7B738|nr:hypothetical protein [Microbacterium esteraromaticum]MCA1306952.1 hypothetical protein [Microbacterium esteraromaticum]
MDEYGPPRCPHDQIVMRDVPDAWECPHCGHQIEIEPAPMPAVFDGPDIEDYRRRRGV